MDIMLKLFQGAVMLKIIRKKGFIKKVLWVLTFVIIISFGFWGTTARVNTPNGRLDYAGKMFGKKISFEQFAESELHARHQALLRYGEEFFKISPFLNLEEEAWNRLILAQEAKRQHIKVNDQEVVESVEALPVFQRDGKFDSLLYNDIIRSFFRCKPRTFEEGIRETILISKLFQKETAAIHVSDQEVFDYYKKQKEKIQVNYILLNAENYKKDAASAMSADQQEEKELKDFYEHNRNSFRVPPTINVEYLTLPFAENISKEGKNKIEEKILQISEELKKNPDLKNAGTKYNVSVQESGFFSQEQPNLKIGWSYELLKKAFELVKGEISPPIETTQGYYILKLKERRSSYIPEFLEVQEKIKDVVLGEKAKEIARTKAAEILKTMKGILQQTPDKKFNELADSVGLSVLQTPLFTKGEYLPTIGVSRDFQDAAFSLDEQNKLSDVVETPKGFCILSLQGREQAKQEDFLKEKDRFAQNLLEEKRSEAINEYLSVLRIRANLEDNIAKLKTSKKVSEE